MKKRIGMILDLHAGFPPDIRVEKEARSLANAGFEVSILVNKKHPADLSREKLDYGLDIIRADINRQNTLVSWLTAIEEFIALVRPDALHVHDLMLVPAAKISAKKHNIPFIADLHENMPAALIAWRMWHENNRFPIISEFKRRFTYHLWRRREKRDLRRCSRIIVVVPEAAERLLKDYGISRKIITVVSNTEDETTFNTLDIDEKIIFKYRDAWPALYIGGMGVHRGIDTSLRAAQSVGKEIPVFKLLIIGFKNAEEKERVMCLARELNVLDHLELIDWVPAYKVNSYIAASKVCLVPHNNFEHTNTTIPHKLFQYMMMRKPVIVSSCRPLKRVVEDAKCGLVFRANDAAHLARCLNQLYRADKNILEEYGENGYKAATGKYSWKNDSRRLIEMYNDLFLLQPK